jgi:nitrate reductase alpha subunit
MAFVFGADVDNHAINTVPKETLVRIVKAESGGIDGVGIWKPALGAFGPSSQSTENLRYLAGEFIRTEG